MLGLPVVWFFTQVIHAHQRDQNTSSWATCKMDWLMLLLSPFVIVFIYPVIFLITMYGGAVFLHVYRHRRRQIYDAYADNFWDGGQQTIAAVFDAHGTLWHGKWFVLFCFWFRKLRKHHLLSWVKNHAESAKTWVDMSVTFNHLVWR